MHIIKEPILAGYARKYAHAALSLEHSRIVAQDASWQSLAEVRAAYADTDAVKVKSGGAHIEIYAEKLTVRSILQKVAVRYTMPLTIARGMSSLPPKKKLVDRYQQSGKNRLIVLAVSDLDPAGDTIAEDLAKCLQRDFWVGADELTVYKVALTIEQVERHELAPSMDAKESSPTYSAFVDKYGTSDAYELEAFEPATLALELEEAIKKVLDPPPRKSVSTLDKDPLRNSGSNSGAKLWLQSLVLPCVPRCAQSMP
jgi:mRNA-degrading endonuclease HigB of HigAB toxin-antitoxin module